MAASNDYLQAAIEGLAPRATDPPLKARPSGEVKSEAIAPPFDPASAKNRLVQEAFLSSPAEMRRVFPQLLHDLSINHTDHLDMVGIDKGLSNPKISDNEKDLLTVLKKGYTVFSRSPCGCVDWDGVSDVDLSVVDKALNRNLAEDPIYAFNAQNDLWRGLAFGAAGGALRAGGDIKTKLLGAAIGAVSGLIVGEGYDWAEKEFGGENSDYDKFKKDYQTFVAGYDRPKPPASRPL